MQILFHFVEILIQKLFHKDETFYYYYDDYYYYDSAWKEILEKYMENYHILLLKFCLKDLQFIDIENINLYKNFKEKVN